ncbi:MAG: HAD-IIIA family hydrolase [Ruminococcaceae bacterium]|nr:HAD-IIIA family hydrolase [Oscillospiraceae bacterium]
MLFEKTLMPDFFFGAFGEVTVEFLISNGFSAVISDIDNTLVPYEIHSPTEEVKKWLSSLEAAGISVAFVSNNHEDRVTEFNRDLSCPAYWDVKKPSAKYLHIAMKALGSDPENTLFLGDQLLTDAWAAHNAGLKAAIVPPIRDKKNLFFKTKRLIEKPYIKKFLKLKG